MCDFWRDLQQNVNFIRFFTGICSKPIKTIEHCAILASGFGFMASGFGFKASGLRRRVSGLRLRVSGLRRRVSGLWLRVSGFRRRVSGFRRRVSGFGFQKHTSTIYSGEAFSALRSSRRPWLIEDSQHWENHSKTEALTPKPEAENPKPEALNPKPEALNRKPYSQNRTMLNGFDRF